MENGGAHTAVDWRTDDRQDVNPSGLTKSLRSNFARALHFVNKPQKDDLHKRELEALDSRLNALMTGETREEIEGQLEGQKILVKRLKGNLKDNRSKLRSVLKDLKASRNRLTPLEDELKKQRKELFEKSMTIDSQRIEIDNLRGGLDVQASRLHMVSQTPDLMLELTNENRLLKTELSELRQRNETLEKLSPAGQKTLKTLNAEIEALKFAKTENQAEIAFLKSENEAAQIRQAELMAELTVLRKSDSLKNSMAAGPIDTSQIQALNDKLHHAAAREAMMEKRLDILRRDLDIVNQTNEMLKGRIAVYEAKALDIPKHAVGF